MKAALVVPERPGELSLVLRHLRTAAAAGAELVLFPETALSASFPSGRDVERDLPLAEPVPGPSTEVLGRTARELGVWVGIGLFEREGDALYDSAVLIGADGETALHYRRVHPGWFYPDADRRVYRCGTELAAAPTPWGEVVFLICGDLFDDGIVDRARELAPALLLVPLARSYEGDLGRWAREEIPIYTERVARAGTPALLANRYGRAFIGGAMVVRADGTIAESVPAGGPGVLLAEVAAE